MQQIYVCISTKNNSTEKVTSMYAGTTLKMLDLVERNRIPLGYGKYKEWEIRIAERVLIHREQALSRTMCSHTL